MLKRLLNIPPENMAVIRRLNFKHPAIWLATWFGLGFIPKAPGTWGTLGALPFGMLLLIFGGVKFLLLGIIVITAAGLWASHVFTRQSGEHDSKMIVIDEVAGFWIAMIPAGIDPLLLLLCFVLFRFFDTLKPWPIGLADKKISGAAGVMIDDILAGAATAVVIFLLQNLGYM
jgi:phosphatidylglycerophosphatase A